MRFSFSRSREAPQGLSSNAKLGAGARPGTGTKDFSDTTPSDSGSSLDSDRATDGKFILQLCDESQSWLKRAEHVLQLTLNNKMPMSEAAQHLRQSLGQTKALLSMGRQFARWEIQTERAAHKRLGLHELIETRLQAHIASFNAHGQDVRRKLKAVDIVADPLLIEALIDSAIAWAVANGARLYFRLEMNTWPVQGRLLIRAQSEGARSAPTSQAGTAWLVLKRLATHAEVEVDGVFGADESVLTLSFPHGVTEHEGISVLEVSSGDHAHTQQMSLENAGPLAGAKVLIVCEDAPLRIRIRDALRPGQLILESVGSVHQAMGVLSIQSVDAIVIPQSQVDSLFYEVRDQILRSVSFFPFIIITDGQEAYQISSPDNSSPCTVDVSALERQLLPALLLELSNTL